MNSPAIVTKSLRDWIFDELRLDLYSPKGFVMIARGFNHGRSWATQSPIEV